MLKLRGSDATAVRRALSGDRGAFAQLVERHDAAAVALAYSRLRTRADAEDAAQEAWVQAYEKLSTLRDPAKFGPWFATIVRHCAARIRERRLREATHRERQHAEVTNGGEGNVAAAVISPDPAVRELREHVRRAVDALDEALREAVLLHYFAGQTSREIGTLLDIPAATVRKRLQRARERLGESLLADVADDFRPTPARTKRVMGAVAATAPAWQSSRASTAALAQHTAGSGTVKAVIAGVVVTAAIVGGGWYWFADAPPPADAQQAEPAVAAIATPAEDAPEAQLDVATDALAADKPPAVETDPQPNPPVRTATLRGIVIDSDGEPAPGADVRVKIYHRFGQEHGTPDMTIRRVTDGQGRFVIGSIPLLPGGWSTAALGVEHKGERSFPRVANSSRPVWDHEWVVKLRPTAPLSGRVLNGAGEPIEGAKIRPVEYESDIDYHSIDVEEIPVSRSDRDGRYRFTGLYLGRWKLLITAPGYAAAELWAYTAAEDESLIKLSPGAKFAGHISIPHGYDLEANPARLELRSVTTYVESYETTLAPDGSFAFDGLRPKEYNLRFEHRELLIKEDVEAVIIESVSDERIENYTAVVGGAVEGRVFDAATGLGLGGVPIQTSLRKTVISNDDGVFILRGLPQGEHSLYRAATPHTPPPDRSPTVPVRKVVVELGETVGPVDWAIDRRHVLTGRVVDETGRPVQGVGISTHSTEPKPGFADAFGGIPYCETDASGTYRVYLNAPTESLFVQAGDADRVSRTSGPLRVEGATPGPTLELEPAGAIAGRIVNPEGRASGRTEVTLHGDRSGHVPRTIASFHNPDGDIRSELTSYTTTALEGYFYVGGLPADTYTVDTGHNTVEISLAPGEKRLDLEIPLYGDTTELLVGKVVYLGEPVPNAQVSSRTTITTTDGDGEFRLPYSGESDYVSAGFRRVIDGIERSRYLGGKVRVTAGERLYLSLGEGSAIIQGKVMTNGEPRPYIDLRLTYTNANGMEETVSATTNSRGEYRLEALPAGTYDMPERPWIRDGKRGSLAVTVANGETVTLDYTVDATAVRPNITGLRNGETARLRILPGYHEVSEVLTEDDVERLDELAIIRKDYTKSEVYAGEYLEPGEYTAVLGAYPSDVGSEAEALANLRLVTAQFEVVRSDEPLELTLTLPE